MSIEAKWKANQDKVSFLKKFPGLLSSWSQTIGHTIQHVKVIKSKPQSAVLIFSDGSFVIVSFPTSEPQELTAGLLEARDLLEQQHPAAFVEYDRLDQLDKNASRIARMENILGAIHNNVEQIPELKDRLRQLVHEWESKR